MSIDALLLATLAIADLGFIAYLRRRHGRRARAERMMASLRAAIRREIDVRELRANRPLLRAS